MQEIEWSEWSKEAFEEAKKQEKLVLLDIHGTWCHWCHVADKTSFADKDVIKLVNEKFVAIKVDLDKRPDINERYNMGGWPTIAILTPEGDIVTGRTYMPAEQLFSLLVRTLDLYKSDRLRFERFIKQNKREREEILVEKTVKLDPSKLGFLDKVIIANFDKENNGFGFTPKFPMPELTSYCFLRYRTTGNREFLEMGEKSLLGVKKIFDKEEGGFYRYAVNRDWSVPHYEKMLEGNSLLLINLLEGMQLTANKEFKQTAEETVSYLQKNLWGSKWFFGSQDADEEYYSLDLVKRREKKKPRVDKTLYTNLNCLAINAFLKAGNVLEKQELIKQAISALNFLLLHCYNRERGVCHYWKEEQKIFGLLSDNVHLIETLLNAFETMQEKEFLEKAEKHAEWVLEKFLDDKQQLLLDSLRVEEEHGYLKEKMPKLGENSLMAASLVKLSMLSEKQAFRKKAETILSNLKGEVERYNLFAASYGIALETCLNPIKISVKGSRELFSQCQRFFEPRATRVFEEAKENSIIVCVSKKCLKPARTSIEMEKLLEQETAVKQKA